MLDQVRGSLHELVADHASDLGIELGHVEVALSAGSVVADVTVTIPDGSSRSDIVQRLANLELQAALETVSSLEGISAVMVGDTLVASFKVDGLEITSTSAAPSLTTSMMPGPLAVPDLGNGATGAMAGVIAVVMAIFVALVILCCSCFWLRKRLSAKRGDDHLGNSGHDVQAQEAQMETVEVHVDALQPENAANAEELAPSQPKFLIMQKDGLVHL